MNDKSAVEFYVWDLMIRITVRKTRVIAVSEIIAGQGKLESCFIRLNDGKVHQVKGHYSEVRDKIFPEENK